METWKTRRWYNSFESASSQGIFNFGEKVKCLLDTGAEVSLADAQVMYSILKARNINPRTIVFDNNYNCKVIGATGHPLNILGKSV